MKPFSSKGSHMIGGLLKALQWTWVEKVESLDQGHTLLGTRACIRNRSCGSYSSALYIILGRYHCGRNDINTLVARVCEQCKF